MRNCRKSGKQIERCVISTFQVAEPPLQPLQMVRDTGFEYAIVTKEIGVLRLFGCQMGDTYDFTYANVTEG